MTQPLDTLPVLFLLRFSFQIEEVDTYYKTSYNLIIWGCGLRRRRAWISLRLLTCSMVSKWFFMHFIATYFPVFMLWAFSTSEKVPSPFFDISRYSTQKRWLVLGWSGNMIRKISDSLAQCIKSIMGDTMMQKRRIVCCSKASRASSSHSGGLLCRLHSLTGWETAVRIGLVVVWLETGPDSVDTGWLALNVLCIVGS